MHLGEQEAMDLHQVVLLEEVEEAHRVVPEVVQVGLQGVVQWEVMEVVIWVLEDMVEMVRLEGQEDIMLQVQMPVLEGEGEEDMEVLEAYQIIVEEAVLEVQVLEGQQMEMEEMEVLEEA